MARSTRRSAHESCIRLVQLNYDMLTELSSQLNLLGQDRAALMKLRTINETFLIDEGVL